MKLTTRLFLLSLVFCLFAGNLFAATAPTIQARYLTFSNLTPTSAKVVWINGNGAKRILVAIPNNATTWANVISNLSNTTEYADNNGLMTGAPQVGTTGAYVVDVLSGGFRISNLSGLVEGVTYALRVFEYNTGGTPAVAYNANTGVNNPRSLRTSFLAPIMTDVTNITSVGGDLNWTDPNAPDAPSYNLWVASDAAFTTIVPAYNGLNITGTTYTMAALNGNTNYWAKIKAIDGLDVSNFSNAVTFLTNPTAPVVNAAGPTTFCAGGSVNLSYTPVAGLTYTWYKDNVAMVETTATINVTASGVYKLSVKNANNVEVFSNLTTVTVNALPANAVCAAPAAICANNTATMIPTPVAGISFRYFSVATGGTAITSGASYTTPALNTTTTYYVEAYNTTTMCAAATRTAVVVTVNSLPDAAVVPTVAPICATFTATMTPTPVAGISFRYFSVATGGTAITSGASYTTPALNTNTTYYVEAYNTTTNCIAAARTAVVVTVNPLPATAVCADPAAICATFTATMTPTPVVGISFRYFDVATGGTALATGASFTTPALTSTKSYFVEAYNTTTNCIAAAREEVVVTVNPLPATAVCADPAAICATFTATMTPTPVAGISFRYFDVATGGTALASGASYTTPALTSTKSYFVEAYNTTTMCIAAAREEVIVTVNPLPATAVCADPAAICATFTATMTPTPVAGINFRYYDAATAGTLLGTGASYTTVALNATTTIYVEAFNTTTNCIAAARKAVLVTVNPLPSAAVVPAVAPICATFTATMTPTPVAGIGFRYFDVLTGGTALNSGASFTTPALTASKTYYVEAYNTTTNCIAAARTAVNVTVNPLPTAAITTPNMTLCVGSGFTLTATAVVGADYQWYKGTTPVGLNQNTYTVPAVALADAGSYTVKVTYTATGCNATSTAVTVAVNSLPTATITGDTQLCSSITLTAGTDAPAATYVWKKDNVAIGGAINSTYSATTPGSYTVVVTNSATNCSKESAAHVITAVPAVGITADPSDVTVGAGVNAVFTATASNATSVRWEVSTDNGMTFTTIPGATTTTLTVTGTTVPMTGNFYRMVAVNSCGEEASYAALLTVQAIAPTTQATGITFNYWSRNEINLSWTRGNGESCVVFAKLAGAGAAAPVAGTEYVPSTTFGLGDDDGNGWFAIYAGTGTNTTVTGLTRNSTYIFHVVEANATGASITYNTTTNATNSLSRLTAYKDGDLSNNETEGFSLISLSPVPATDHLTIVVSSDNAQPMNVELFNINGERVIANTFDVTSGSNTISLSLGETGVLPAGSYTLRLSTSTGVIGKQIVVMP